MKIIDKIKKSDKTLFSFEILPPLKGSSINSIFHCIDKLIEFEPSFVDVTYHREEFILKKRADGSYDRIVTRKRPGTVAICASIQNKYKVDAVPHIICGGFTKEDTENALIDLDFLGIRNILALRGDNAKTETQFVPEPGGNRNALELINQVSNMNSGIYLDEELQNPTPTDFCIGAACYPEKHQDAPNMMSDLNYTKRKVEAGAEFLTTQMFFDNKNYFSFIEKCKEAGINIPIIPGIKPITNRNQLYLLPKYFKIDIPFELSNAIEKAKTDEEVKQIGIDWCIEQCKELKATSVPVLHFYTMGYPDITSKIAKQVF
ncbi:MAG: methylenetetrahydrofolate reductase [NAD(P)H] [Bacteroidia bacterium]|nr:methylenetetrahydrofolate reductase [NAD(P)H] [Bacteroidia bacterium]